MACHDNMQPRHMIIPSGHLSPQALDGLIQEFVTRSGTDYGRREASLEEKCAAVRRQLADGRAHIAYDSASRTCTIIPSEDVCRSAQRRKEKEMP